MKNKIILIGIFFFTYLGMATAQYCPTPARGQNIGYNSYGSFNNGLSGNNLSRITYDYAYAINRGFRNGDLTRHEVFVLENDLNRLARRIERAYYDGRISSSEWTFIQFDMRNFERNISREWNDDQRRDS
ncbi:MAG: hypothetical protein V3V00_04980 [Saprospiraceae bacterium]